VARGVALAGICLVLVVPVAGAGAAPIRFEHEGMTAFYAQLSAHSVHAVTFNRVAHSLHISLNDGRHMLAVYPPKQYKAITARILAKGVPVKVEKSKSASSHHKLRYIAAAVLVLIILLVVLVIGLNRRQKGGRSPETEQPPGEPVSPDPSQEHER
jgi:hypothetical protein